MAQQPRQSFRSIMGGQERARRLVTNRIIPNMVQRSVSSSPFATMGKPGQKSNRVKRKFIPHEAAVALTDEARQFFKALLEDPPRPNIIGIMLNFEQSSSGEPRMVFSFQFVTRDEIMDDDEGVSLEVLEDGSPKPPVDSIEDGLPKLYVSHNSFLKVLGCTLDVDKETYEPVLTDRNGNALDPNV